MAIESEHLRPLSGETQSSWQARLQDVMLRAYRSAFVQAIVLFFSRSVRRRIVATNLLGLIILLVGLFVLSQHNAWLIDAKRESLQTQGKIIAAALASNASIDMGGIVLDRDTLPTLDESRAPVRDDAFASLGLSLRPDQVIPVIRRLMQSTNTRARIYGRDGTLIVDSNTFLENSLEPPVVNATGPSNPKVKKFWQRITKWFLGADLKVYREIGTANGRSYDEVRIALNGTPATMLLLDEAGRQIVSQAEPIRRFRSVHGVLLLSTRPGEIDDILASERNAILVVAGLALIAVLIASWLLARTIAGPMRRLSSAAEEVSLNINASKSLPDLSYRKDEIGMLGDAFQRMTASLYRRIEASERFAADVAHELKNPLTAARSTAEAMAFAKTDADRNELISQLQQELKRLNRLITDVSKASRLDAELAMQETKPVDVVKVLEGVVPIFEDRAGTIGGQVVVDVATRPNGTRRQVVRAHEGRLAQVIVNLIDNALSFSPEGGTVRVRVRRQGPEVELAIEDDGPGIPPDKLETIFHRFYSDRPATDSTLGKNSGLGLSISREIVLAHNGRIWAENRQPPQKGARFVIRLPALVRAPGRNGAGDAE